MAVIATTYGQFLMDLGNARHSFTNDHYWLGLLTSSYLPDYNYDTDWSVISYNTEVPDHSAGDPDGNDYWTNGLRITGLDWQYDSGTKTGKLAADSVIWGALNATFRFAVVYKFNSGDSSKPLVGCLDYGSNQVYTGQVLTVDFSSGLLTVAAA